MTQETAPVVELVDVTIKLPVVRHLQSDTVAYRTTHVDCHLGTADQQAAMRRLQDGLDAAGRRLDSGVRVLSSADVVRFVMERVEAAFRATGKTGSRKGAKTPRLQDPRRQDVKGDWA